MRRERRHASAGANPARQLSLQPSLIVDAARDAGLRNDPGLELRARWTRNVIFGPVAGADVARPDPHRDSVTPVGTGGQWPDPKLG